MLEPRSFFGRKAGAHVRGRLQVARAIGTLCALSLSISCDVGESLAPGTSEAPDPTTLALAYRLRVDMLTGTVAVVAPGGRTGPASPGAPHDVAPPPGPLHSLLGGDAAELRATNPRTTPDRRTTRVVLDLDVFNRLATVDLVTPTFPEAPAGLEGIFVIPFDFTITSSRKSAQVTASPDWDGEPHNFFNDSQCKNSPSGCFRWERFQQPLHPGALSETREIGFDVDNDVTSFEVFLLLAADLEETATGSVRGTVTSPAFGTLQGVIVTAGAVSDATDASGQYLLTGLPLGTATLTLAGLPEDCVDPGPASVVVTAGPTLVHDFSIACTPQTPVANAGGDQDVALGASVTLDGSASLGPQPLAYSWRQTAGPPVAGLPATTPSVTFTAPAGVTVLEFELEVSRGGTSDTDVVHVWVLEDPSRAVWVSTLGSDANDGARASPLRNVQPGIAAAAAMGGGDVYLAAGSYVGNVVLADGVSLYGGFRSDWLRRDPDGFATSTLPAGPVAGHVTAVFGSSVADLTIEGLRILSSGAPIGSGSSYGVRLVGSAGVVLRGNLIQAGAGGAAVNGVSGSPGTAGVRGADGGPGQPDGALPGNGGPGGPGPGHRGGDGGRGGAQGANTGLSGATGQGPNGGGGGAGGAGGNPGQAGGPGFEGVNGPDGPNGLGGAGGSVVGGHFRPQDGQAGQPGQPGSGGGGGGGGGGQGGLFVIDGAGNGGGGGGAGGSGGGAGGGGFGGGGSFAVFLVDSSVELHGNDIRSAEGGRGGAGGLGAFGAPGGVGGRGGTAGAGEIGFGGNGGQGGQGGRGGHGGGGAGGPSFGIYSFGASSVTESANSIQPGAGGVGGSSPGVPGTNGPSGARNF